MLINYGELRPRLSFDRTLAKMVLPLWRCTHVKQTHRQHSRRANLVINLVCIVSIAIRTYVVKCRRTPVKSKSALEAMTWHVQNGIQLENKSSLPGRMITSSRPDAVYREA